MTLFSEIEAEKLGKLRKTNSKMTHSANYSVAKVILRIVDRAGQKKLKKKSTRPFVVKFN